MSDELADKIEENAQAPKRFKSDNTEVEQHPLKEQIEADRYRKSNSAARRSFGGLRFTKLVPPGGDGT